ncbi:Ig-like domain-containing protein [Cellulomonas sp. GbtcB1]|uniref:Ig-like domain-containing protein n=1 Tax=Cellulomonas sp. GbtcB1 TaxID=2824746 RepID=UPI001C2FE0C9|nr:Ig-like domain-containing protein [Cellulomonas sp. GbtcB1]
MRHSSRRRAGRLTLVLLLALGVGAGLPAVVPGAVPAAVAAPADDCAAPTRSVAGGGWAAVSVAAGEVVQVTGRFTAGIGALAPGGTLCVAPGAVLAPAYVTEPGGVLHVAAGGTATLPWTSARSGFVLDNAGTTTFQGLNVNGPATLRNAAGATLEVRSAFNPSGGTIENAGTLRLPAGVTLNGGVVLTNTGALTAGAPVTVNGSLQNTGTATLAQALLVNGSGRLDNGCVLQVGGALTLAGGSATNAGLVTSGGTFTTSGASTWRQAGTGALSAGDLLDDGAVTGFGRYVFTGSSIVHNRFAGDSPASPVTVDVPGGAFGTVTGTVANVAFADVTLPPASAYPAPGCAGAAAPVSADVQVAMTGPSHVAPGTAVTYAITVTNAGPSPAAGVVIRQALPAAPRGTLSAVTADQGGVVSASAVQWDLGTLASGASRTLTVAGTAPTSGFLESTVAATSSTPDPDPGNNDGSAATERVATEIDTVLVRPGPTTADLTFEGVGGVPVLGALTGTAGFPDAQLRYRVTSPGDAGAIAMLPSGLFAFLPPDDWAGTDSFQFEVCDNQAVPLCDQATATVTLHPQAAEDRAITDADVPVVIPVSANDSGGAVLTGGLDTPASNGRVDLDPSAGSLTYTPDPGFVGDDAFTYRACASGDPADCVTAVVRVTVEAVDHPPQVAAAARAISVGQAAVVPLDADDPDGDPTVITTVFPPSHGTATPDGRTTRYQPEPGFAGVDRYGVVVCDDRDPALCSTGEVVVTVLPVAADDTARTTAGTPVTVDVLANDAGTVLDPEVVSTPGEGTVRVASGALVYTPRAGFTGTDTFGYRICAQDGSGACAEAAVTVAVVAADGITPPVDDGPGASVIQRPGPGGSASGESRTTPGRLARTGSDAALNAGIAALLVAAGGGAIGLSRLRRRA